MENAILFFRVCESFLSIINTGGQKTEEKVCKNSLEKRFLKNNPRLSCAKLEHFSRLNLILN